MSVDALSTCGFPNPWWRRIKHYTCYTLGLLVLFSFLSASIVLIEFPLRLIFGWIFHGMQTLPAWLANWRAALLPMGCLAMAGVLLHRFIHRFRASWRSMNTVAALALLLLGCGAAISLSGVMHQAVWLMGSPITEDRGKRSEQTYAVNNARQLVMALLEFHDVRGQYPESLTELSDLGRIRIGSGRVTEPFILLLPGRERPAGANEAMLISPVVENGTRIVVGYGDGSVRSESVRKLKNILQIIGQETPVERPR